MRARACVCVRERERGGEIGLQSVCDDKLSLVSDHFFFKEVINNQSLNDSSITDCSITVSTIHFSSVVLGTVNITSLNNQHYGFKRQRMHVTKTRGRE